MNPWIKKLILIIIVGSLIVLGIFIILLTIYVFCPNVKHLDWLGKILNIPKEELVFVTVPETGSKNVCLSTVPNADICNEDVYIMNENNLMLACDTTTSNYVVKCNNSLSANLWRFQLFGGDSFLLINKETGGFLWYEGDEIQYVVSPPEDKEPAWPGPKESSRLFKVKTSTNARGIKVYSIQSSNGNILQFNDNLDANSPTNIKFVRQDNQENTSLNNPQNQWVIIPAIPN